MEILLHVIVQEDIVTGNYVVVSKVIIHLNMAFVSATTLLFQPSYNWKLTVYIIQVTVLPVILQLRIDSAVLVSAPSCRIWGKAPAV